MPFKFSNLLVFLKIVCEYFPTHKPNQHNLFIIRYINSSNLNLNKIYNNNKKMIIIILFKYFMKFWLKNLKIFKTIFQFKKDNGSLYVAIFKCFIQSCYNILRGSFYDYRSSMFFMMLLYGLIIVILQKLKTLYFVLIDRRLHHIQRKITIPKTTLQTHPIHHQILIKPFLHYINII